MIKASPRVRWRSSTVHPAGEAGPNAVSPELVSAMVPEQILQEDEVVLLLTKPSLFYLFYDSFFFVVVTLLFGMLAGQFARTGATLTPATVALITTLLCVGRLVWALLVWTSHVYMLTNLRVVTLKGVVNVHVFQANLRKIQKTDLYRPIGQRLFGTGTICFSTAAAAGTVDSSWVMIARPVETHEQIVAAINRSQSR